MSKWGAYPDSVPAGSVWVGMTEWERVIIVRVHAHTVWFRCLDGKERGMRWAAFHEAYRRVPVSR